MQEEIFGPILVKSYKSTDEAIGYVNDHDRPLGLYYFGDNKAEESKVINSTTSGGVTVNDVITHIMQDDAPFGGVGPSSTSAYHGHAGFYQFNAYQTVFRQSPFEFAAGALRHHVLARKRAKCWPASSRNKLFFWREKARMRHCDAYGFSFSAFGECEIVAAWKKLPKFNTEDPFLLSEQLTEEDMVIAYPDKARALLRWKICCPTRHRYVHQ